MERPTLDQITKLANFNRACNQTGYLDEETFHLIEYLIGFYIRNGLHLTEIMAAYEEEEAAKKKALEEVF